MNRLLTDSGFSCDTELSISKELCLDFKYLGLLHCTVFITFKSFQSRKNVSSAEIIFRDKSQPFLEFIRFGWDLYRKDF